MADIYANKTGVGYVMYNDQLPNGDSSSSYGHMKGVLSFDNTSGFFIQHSVPDFVNYAKDGWVFSPFSADFESFMIDRSLHR